MCSDLFARENYLFAGLNEEICDIVLNYAIMGKFPTLMIINPLIQGKKINYFNGKKTGYYLKYKPNEDGTGTYISSKELYKDNVKQGSAQKWIRISTYTSPLTGTTTSCMLEWQTIWLEECLNTGPGWLTVLRNDTT